MIKFLVRSKNLFDSLNNEYIQIKDNGVLASMTPTAFTSFIIIRMTCEFEYELKKIVLTKLKSESKSSKIHLFIDQKTLLKSSKMTLLKKNLKEHILTIDDMGSLFDSTKSVKDRLFFDRIFGAKKDEEGEKNIRNQLAHWPDFDYINLPLWDEVEEYIEVCDNVLKNIELNLKFLA